MDKSKYIIILIAILVIAIIVTVSYYGLGSMKTTPTTTTLSSFNVNVTTTIQPEVVQITKLYYNISRPNPSNPSLSLKNTLDVKYTNTEPLGFTFNIILGISASNLLKNTTLSSISMPTSGFTIENITPSLPITFNSLHSFVKLNIVVRAPKTPYRGPLSIDINYT